jgi:hypothetical protein
MVNAICVAKDEYFRTEGLISIILKSELKEFPLLERPVLLA